MARKPHTSSEPKSYSKESYETRSYPFKAQSYQKRRSTVAITSESTVKVAYSSNENGRLVKFVVNIPKLIREEKNISLNRRKTAKHVSNISSSDVS